MGKPILHNYTDSTIAPLEGIVSTYFARNPEKIPKIKNNIIRIAFSLIFDMASFSILLKVRTYELAL